MSNVTFAPSVCGRPPRNDIGMFSSNDTTFPPPKILSGDPNYGYVQGGCPTNVNSIPACNTLPNKSTSSLSRAQNSQPYTCQGRFNNTVAAYTPGCYAAGMCVQTQGDPYSFDHYMCQSNWDMIDQYRPGCCGGIYSSSDKCAPEWCAQNIDGNQADSLGCAQLMLNFCTSASGNAPPSGGGPDMYWTEGNLVNIACTNAEPNNSYPTFTLPAGYQSSSSNTSYDTIDAGRACDNFLVSNGDSPTTQKLISTAAQNFFSGMGNTELIQARTNPFMSKIITLCRDNPGVCDSTLTSVCSNLTLSDLDPTQYSSSGSDPAGTNLLNLCGCYLPADQYTWPNNIPCNMVCNMPQTIKPLLDSNGQPFSSCNQVCVIDNVAIDSLNSSTGAVTLNQMCPTGVCYFSSIDTLNKASSQVTSQITQVCNQCGILPPPDADGNIDFTKVQCVDCTTGQSSTTGGQCGSIIPPTPPSNNGGTTAPSFLQRIETFLLGIKNSTRDLIGAISILFLVLFFLVVIIILYSYRS